MYDAAGIQWHAASRFMPSAQAPAYMLMHGHSSINAGKISSSGQERKSSGTGSIMAGGPPSGISMEGSRTGNIFPGRLFHE